MTTITKNITSSDFETIYLQLRQQEGRIYNDYEVMQLPHISPSHPYYSEWMVRSRSSLRLINYLKKKNRPLNILEIGCGNGWLCHQLASINKSHVIGIDVNFLELQQAARVFQDIPNLCFVYTDITQGLFRENNFDIIIFAASLQYFDSTVKICDIAWKMLKTGGEIHILDTPFYPQHKLDSARKRSRQYYEKMGFPFMTDHYHHHSIAGLNAYNPSILYNPSRIINRFKKRKSPFHWIRLQR